MDLDRSAVSPDQVVQAAMEQVAQVEQVALKYLRLRQPVPEGTEVPVRPGSSEPQRSPVSRRARCSRLRSGPVEQVAKVAAVAAVETTNLPRRARTVPLVQLEPAGTC